MTKLLVSTVVSAIGMLLIVGGSAFVFIFADPLGYAPISGGAVLIAVGTLLHYFIVTRKKS